MNQLPELGEGVQDFWDYKLKGFKLLGTKVRGLEVNDLIVDEFGIIGMVKYQSEKYGNLIEFIDGLEVYDTKLTRVKKLTFNSPSYFEYHQRHWGFSIRLARIIKSSLEEFFPHVNMRNDGKSLILRGSTMQAVTKRFTNVRVGKIHNYIQFSFSPFWNCNLDILEVKPFMRKSSFTYNMLRNLFIDIDLKMTGRNLIRWKINEHNDWIDPTWARIFKHFGRFHLKKARGD